MTVEEYAALQAAISAALVSTVLRVINPYRVLPLDPITWDHILNLLYPYVVAAREESAVLGREFYDSERELHAPSEPRHDLFLAEYNRAWFTEAMFPARQEFLKPGASNFATVQVALRAVKEVENGGRRTIIRAVHEDPVVKGWARVATGRETCGFCMMLVSRGPVYTSAENAGLDTDDTSAVELWRQIDNASTPAERQAAEEAFDELMNRWHTGCDCKAVPVFKKANWPGRDAFLRAEKLWEKHTKGFSGKDAMNAFRRAIESGDVDVREMSIAA